MRLGRNKGAKNNMMAGRPARNQSKKNLYLAFIIIITALLILWVYSMGRKAEDTVTVVMLKDNVYKNQVITENMLQPYEMLVGEFEKFAVVNENGVKTRRILLWDERDMIINSFAAYPLKANTYAEVRDFIKSRVDNSDNVLYSFPGKDIIKLDIATQDLQAFKTFLQPGDRLNISAVYSTTETILEDDGYGGTIKNTVESFKTEDVFRDIMLADLLNSNGESILDIYASYKEMTVYEQAKLDASQSFKESVTPVSLLVALTPEEKERYYYFSGKSQVEFKASLPQRVE